LLYYHEVSLFYNQAPQSYGYSNQTKLLLYLFLRRIFPPWSPLRYDPTQAIGPTVKSMVHNFFISDSPKIVKSSHIFMIWDQKNERINTTKFIHSTLTSKQSESMGFVKNTSVLKLYDIKDTNDTLHPCRHECYEECDIECWRCNMCRVVLTMASGHTHFSISRSYSMPNKSTHAYITLVPHKPLQQNFESWTNLECDQ